MASAILLPGMARADGMLNPKDFHLPTSAKEMPELRTDRTVTFDLGDGRRAAVSRGLPAFDTVDNINEPVHIFQQPLAPRLAIVFVMVLLVGTAGAFWTSGGKKSRFVGTLFFLAALAGLLLLWRTHAFADTSGPNNPGTLANDASHGSIAWVNPTNASTSNNVYATDAFSGGSQQSQYLKATNFGFTLTSGGLSGSTINGILVEVERNTTSADISPTDDVIEIVKRGTISTPNKAAGGNWPTSDAYASYGSASDLWSNTWTTSDISATNFGMVISAKTPATVCETCPTGQIDHIRVTITYTTVGGGASTTNVHHRQILLD